MATSEERIDRLEEKYSDLHTVVNVLATNVNNLTNELRDFKNEMREQNKMRATEMAEIRRSIEETNKATDAKIDAIRVSVDGMGKHIRNLSYASIGAIAAMVITVLLNLPNQYCCFCIKQGKILSLLTVFCGLYEYL